MQIQHEGKIFLMQLLSFIFGSKTKQIFRGGKKSIAGSRASTCQTKINCLESLDDVDFDGEI